MSARNIAIRQREKNAMKTPKSKCQHPYQGYLAKEMAQQRREDRAAATLAATEQFRDPRADMSPAELRAELEQRTGKSMHWPYKFIVCITFQ